MDTWDLCRKLNIGGSSKGRTSAFEAENFGSIPSPPVRSFASECREAGKLFCLRLGFEARIVIASADAIARAGPSKIMSEGE